VTLFGEVKGHVDRVRKRGVVRKFDWPDIIVEGILEPCEVSGSEVSVKSGHGGL